MAKSDVLVRMKADTQNYDANIAKARRTLDQFKKDNLSMGGVMKQMSGSLVATAAKFASVGAAIGAVTSAIRGNIETAKNFEKSMSQLSSLTGMVGDDLAKLKDYAIELGSSTTLSASQVADAFKLIGSQQPQLLASGEALKAVTKNAITLAEAAGIELADAAQTLSVSINQMGGDSSNAERYINVLAAASQKGAGDIVWLGEAITKSGTTAKAVGTDYEELVANLEQLAKAGYDASTAGTALRSIIMNLEKQANNDYKPSVVGLTEAFKNLGEANLTLTQYQEIAGKMFAAQAKALADAAGEAANMKEQITGTNTAEEQAKTNTDNLDGSLKALASAWEGFNLHINSSNGLLRDLVDFLKDVVEWADKAYQALERYYNGPNVEDIITGGLNDVTDTVDDNGRLIRKDAIQSIPDIVVTGHAPSGGKGGKKGSGGTQHIKTEEELNTEAIKKLASEYEKASAERRAAIQEEIKVLQKRNQEIQHYKDLATGKAWEYQGIDISKVEKPKSLTPSLLNTGAGLSPDKLPKILSPLQQINAEIQRTQELMEMAPTKDAYTQMAEHLEELKKKQDDFTSGSRNVGNSWKVAAQAIQQAGSALSAVKDPAVQVASTVAMAIANIALAYSESLAKDKTNKSNIWYFIGTAAAAVASMVTTISSIHSATGYAEGGEVKGNTYSGDQIPIMANAGEIILNRAQAGVVASSLQNGDNGGGSGLSYITGEQIFLALNRYTKRSGRGEIVTWNE